MSPAPLVRIAEIKVDPDWIEAYRAHLTTQIDAAIAQEPGVLALQAVAEQEDPSKVWVFEVYRDRAAYEAHILTPHFLAYKRDTAEMVQSLRLVDTVPIRLGAKP